MPFGEEGLHPGNASPQSALDRAPTVLSSSSGLEAFRRSDAAAPPAFAARDADGMNDCT
jgi:hypothetical protein